MARHRREPVRREPSRRAKILSYAALTLTAGILLGCCAACTVAFWY